MQHEPTLRPGTSSVRLAQVFSGLIVVAGVAVSTGCGTTTPTPVASRPAAAVSTSDLATDARSTRPPTPGRARQAQIDAAITGLSLEDGRLQVAAARRGDTALARALVREAAERAGAGYAIEALALYTEALLEDAGSAGAYAGLGRVLAYERRVDEAIGALRSALDREPSRVPARLLLAELLQARAELVPAIGELESLLRQSPRHGGAHARLATYLHYAGDADGARRHVAQADRWGGDVPSPLRHMLAHGGAPPRATVTKASKLSFGGSNPVGPQVRVDSGSDHANETSAAAAELFPNQVLAGWHDYSEPGTIRVAAGISQNGGASFQQQLIRPPVSFRGTIEGDPMTAFDPRTGNSWIGGITFNPSSSLDHVFVARRTPGASTFGTPSMVLTNVDVDKAFLAAGRLPGNPNATRLYIVYRGQVPLRSELRVSNDFGATWSAPTTFADGLGHVPRIGPGGELYMVTWDTSLAIELMRSTNGGASVSSPISVATRMDTWFDDSRTPGRFRAVPLAYLAVDPSSGDLYVVYFDTTNIVGGQRNVDLYFTRSTNGGDTWTPPVVINDDPPTPGDQFFPWVEVDALGRIHVLYFDSSNTVQNDNQTNGWLDAYYQVSSDQGATWTAYRLTPSSFGSADGDPFGQQFLGDYLGMGVSDGNAHPVYLSTQNGDEDIFTHTIAIGPPPTARDDAYVTYIGTPIDIVWSDLLVNDLDVTLSSVCSNTQPTLGTLTPFPGGATYQPPLGGTTTDTIGYTVCGPSGTSSATLSIEIKSGILTLGDDFDDGIDPAWTKITAGKGNTVVASTAAALQGDQGLRVSIGPGGQAHLETTDTGSQTYGSRFHLDPRGLTMANGNTFTVFEAWKNSVGQASFEVQLNRNAGVYRVRGRARTDAGAWQNSAWRVIEGPVSIGVDWWAQQPPFTVGGLRFSVDGQLVTELAVSNAQRSIDRVRLGAVRGVDTGTSGQLDIDSFFSHYLAVR